VIALRLFAIDHPVDAEFVGAHPECVCPKRLIQRHRHFPVARKVIKEFFGLAFVVEADRKRNIATVAAPSGESHIMICVSPTWIVACIILSSKPEPVCGVSPHFLAEKLGCTKRVFVKIIASRQFPANEI
jgi:hypothetical protein